MPKVLTLALRTCTRAIKLAAVVHLTVNTIKFVYFSIDIVLIIGQVFVASSTSSSCFPLVGSISSALRQRVLPEIGNRLFCNPAVVANCNNTTFEGDAWCRLRCLQFRATVPVPDTLCAEIEIDVSEIRLLGALARHNRVVESLETDDQHEGG